MAHINSKPDQALLDLCGRLPAQLEEFNTICKTGFDTEDYYCGTVVPTMEGIMAMPAITLAGIKAKGRALAAYLAHDFVDAEVFAKSLCDDLLRMEERDRYLIDLCRRCVEALTVNEAIYDAVPRGEDISAEVAQAASDQYDEQVVPLLHEIEKTPTTTLEGFVAKARVFMSSNLETHGEDNMADACGIMLNDLSGLNLVPEVPEAPHHYTVVRAEDLATAAQEAA